MARQNEWKSGPQNLRMGGSVLVSRQLDGMGSVGSRQRLLAKAGPVESRGLPRGNFESGLASLSRGAGFEPRDALDGVLGCAGRSIDDTMGLHLAHVALIEKTA